MSTRGPELGSRGESLKLRAKVQPRCSLPVAFLAVFNHQLLELLVHLPVEVVPQEEGPEAEQRVHLLRLADPQALAL